MLQRRQLNAGKCCENTQRLLLGILICSKLSLKPPDGSLLKGDIARSHEFVVGIICLVFARNLSRRSRHMSLLRHLRMSLASQMEHFIEQPWCSCNTLMILK